MTTGHGSDEDDVAPSDGQGAQQGVEEAPIRVPHRRLSAEVLRAVAEDFCTRDGTDYGETEMPLEQRVSLLMRQLERGEAHILYEAVSETLRIVSSHELPVLDDPDPDR